jgi:hypothetical protein
MPPGTTRRLQTLDKEFSVSGNSYFVACRTNDKTIHFQVSQRDGIPEMQSLVQYIQIERRRGSVEQQAMKWYLRSISRERESEKRQEREGEGSFCKSLNLETLDDVREGFVINKTM